MLAELREQLRLLQEELKRLKRLKQLNLLKQTIINILVGAGASYFLSEIWNEHKDEIYAYFYSNIFDFKAKYVQQAIS